MSAINLIKSSPLFYELYDEEIEKIIKDCAVSKYRAGETIIKEGESGNELFVILAGEAETFKLLRDKNFKVGDLKKGDAFGETALINDPVRATSVIAVTDCDLLVIDHETIFGLFKTDTQIFAVIILNLARMLTARLRASNRAITTMHEKAKRAA